MKIEGLKRYQRRGRSGGHFEGLPPQVRACARGWLERFVTRRRSRGQPVPQWLFAILIGQAKRLALRPPTSAWGRSMHARRGGHAVQRQYLHEGRHPTEKATRVHGLTAQVRANVQSNEEEPSNLPAITLSGVCRSGFTGRDQAESILAKIRRLISLDSNFGQHIAPPRYHWE